jgi:hypothetical protein
LTLHTGVGTHHTAQQGGVTGRGGWFDKSAPGKDDIPSSQGLAGGPFKGRPEMKGVAATILGHFVARGQPRHGQGIGGIPAHQSLEQGRSDALFGNATQDVWIEGFGFGAVDDDEVGFGATRAA